MWNITKMAYLCKYYNKYFIAVLAIERTILIVLDYKLSFQTAFAIAIEKER